jgi:hypothetical protein
MARALARIGHRFTVRASRDKTEAHYRSLFDEPWETATKQWLAAHMAPALEREYPLTGRDRDVIASNADDPLTVAHMLVDARCPRWFLGWRDICRATDERTVIASVIPRVAVGDKYLLMLPRASADLTAALQANLDAFVLDYCSRQKVGGTSLKYFTMRQLPILQPSHYSEPPPWDCANRDHSIGSWILPRALELTYTARDLAAFARDCGYSGPPFRWNAERRFLLRAELDAAFFHLYSIAHDDVGFVLDSFPLVRRDDEKRHGEYRTRRVILEIYDAMQRAIETGLPYRTVLDPPPADPTVAHASSGP